MKLLQLNGTAMIPSTTDTTSQLLLANYPNTTEVQPLTGLMLEIITFQMEERALFTNPENLPASISSFHQNNSLN